MPTVIDSLVVELGLDDTNYQQGRRRVEADVQQLRRTGNLDVGVNLDERQIQQKFRTLSTNLTRFQAQARQTGLTPTLRGDIDKTVASMNVLRQQGRLMGTSLEMSTAKATTGLLGMASAGINAYAALKLIEGFYKRTSEVSERVTAAGQIAGYTGLDDRRFRAIARGFEGATGAPAGETQQALFGMSQQISQLQRGLGGTEFFTALTRLAGEAGVSAPMQGATEQETLENAMRVISEAMPKLSQTAQQTYGALLGLPPRVTEALGKGMGFSAAEREGLKNTPDAGDTKLLTDALRKLKTSTDGLEEKIAALTAGPLATLVTEFTHLIDAIQKDLIGAIGKFIFAMTGANPLAGPFAPGSAGAGEKEANEAFRKLSPADQKRAMEGKLPLPPDTRPWYRRGPSWLGGQPRSLYPGQGDAGTPGTGPASATGSLSQAQLHSLALAAGFKGQDAAIAAATFYSESKGDPNAVGDLSLGGSYGVTQINRRAHGDVALEARGNPARAMALAYDLYQKDKAAGRSGFTDWTNYKTGEYKKYLGSAGGQRGQDTGYAGFPTMGPNAKFPALPPNTTNYKDTSGPGIPTEPATMGPRTAAPHREVAPPASTMEQFRGSGQEPNIKNMPGPTYLDQLRQLGDATRAARATTAAGGSGGATTTNQTGGDMNIAHVEIHTNATDAKGIAKDFHEELRDQIKTDALNTGLF